MPAIINELLQLEKLDGAQRPPVLPVDGHLQLPGLVQHNGEPLVPRLLAARFPTRPRHLNVVKLQHCRDLIARLVLDVVALWAAPRYCLEHGLDVRGGWKDGRVFPSSSRNILYQVLTAHQAHLQLSCDGCGGLIDRGRTGWYAPGTPALGLRIGVPVPQVGKAAWRHCHCCFYLVFQLLGLVGANGQLLPDQLHAVSDQVQLLAGLWQVLLRLLQCLLVLTFARCQDLQHIFGTLQASWLNFHVVSQVLNPPLQRRNLFPSKISVLISRSVLLLLCFENLHPEVLHLGLGVLQQLLSLHQQPLVLVPAVLAQHVLSSLAHLQLKRHKIFSPKFSSPWSRCQAGAAGERASALPRRGTQAHPQGWPELQGTRLHRSSESSASSPASSISPWLRLSFTDKTVMQSNRI